jgi:hypothetical protein
MATAKGIRTPWMVFKLIPSHASHVTIQNSDSSLDLCGDSRTWAQSRIKTVQCTNEGGRDYVIKHLVTRSVY